MPICLPEELCIEILSRLPVKSVVCFMSVCKSWHSLIGTSEFVSLHLSKGRACHLFCPGYHDAANPSFALVKLDDEPRELQSQVSFNLDYPFYIDGSCDGVLCLSLFHEINRAKVMRDEEVFKDILFPDNFSRNNVEEVFVSVVGEALGAIENVGFFCCIWVMEEYGVVESWTKFYKIEFFPSEVLPLSKVIGVRRNGEVAMVAGTLRKILVTYDPKTGQINKDPETLRGLSFVGNYRESLILPGGEKHSAARSPLIIEFKSPSEEGDVPQVGLTL